ncbi:sodium/proline symporter [Corynebacterium kutscheri]|uniref:Sodium/proline symporter n=1 Tax=Corynebacterium kutscheri TaxID=35755 RepID=A0A0F6R144_9CORY|nr:sodium/proline symporter PutP [Corynebacterium kutscheri]AKE40808.1 sodium/proline symporter [Corynebacterium kutscheri]VEH04459.1 sodium/proline symporter [Corynebacterium kutscheri]VEH09105.1 sodium/proline symporter [Corynebacterium kutscheri]VEH80316.1 sodium/proline symporter [Corynebacterium kutscheri]
MSENTWFIIAIIIYMAAMLLIGYWSYRQTNEYDDYVLAGRGLNPFVAAMSAGASDMSGWLLMGLPGALFVTGFSELWIAIGLIIGCWANWRWIAPRLRAYTEVADNSLTLPSFFENRFHTSSRSLRIVSAVIIIVFFTFYVSSGMVSGGRYFESTFGGNYLDGMLIVAAITVGYTFIGGFLAVSYTDAVQGSIMFFSLMVVPIMALFALDDPTSIFSYAAAHDYGPYVDGIGNPTYFSMVNGVSFFAIVGSLAWGLGYFGQPHIVVRFMALRSPQEAKQGGIIGVSWMSFCIAGAFFVALVGTAFFGQNEEYSIVDQVAYETIFLDMGRILFHPLIAGLILTAVLAAIMSTISSQLLVTSTSLVEDIYRGLKKQPPSEREMLNLSRIAVLAVSVVAGILAVNPSDSILGLVAFAWAGFGSAFGPVVLAALYWKRLNAAGALAGMLTGAFVSFIWGNSALSDTLYEIVPGFVANAVVMVIVTLLSSEPTNEVKEEFEHASKLARA